MIGIAVNTRKPTIQGLMRKKPQPASRTDAFSRRLDGAGRTVLVGSPSIRALNGATPMPSGVVMAVRKNSVTRLSTPPARSEAAGFGERTNSSSQLPEPFLNSGHNGSRHVQN